MSMMRVCPTCGRPYAKALKVSGSLRQRLVDVLLNRVDGVEMQDLIKIIYATEPHGAPMYASNSIAVMTHMANEELRAQGYAIVATRGRGSRYRIVELPEA